MSQLQNSLNVQKFYQEVFQDFKNRLFTVYRFKSCISSQQIDKFTKIIKEKLSKKRELFDTGIRLTLDKGKSGEELGLNKVKVEHQQQDDYYRQAQLKQPIKQQLQQQDKNSQQSQDDDLKQFKRQKEPFNVKQQPQQKEQADNNNSEQQYQQQDKMKQDILAKSSKKICAHIIASYSTKNKKHIPKDEKTKIELENVFIRTPEREVFYAKITCDFSQAQYSNIKL